MVREISAGGVVVRKSAVGWECAVIEPHKEPGPSATGRKRAIRQVLALPKGLIDEGEKAEEAALREVFEETGITALPITKLTDIKYVYVRSWSDHERVFKIVSFYLLRYASGEIDNLSQAMRTEVKRALWLPLDEAAHKLAYRGEREALKLAQEYLAQDREAVT
jgi:8-oxo-dGTP pyrophosphatase MutT (NUDIX family)